MHADGDWQAVEGALSKELESCTGGLQVPAFAGWVREPTLPCVRVPIELVVGWEQVVLGAGAG